MNRVSLLLMKNAWLNYRGIAALMAILLTTVSLFADQHQAAIDKLQDAITYEVELKQLPAFSIAIVDRQGVRWSAGFGFEDTEQKRPATAETLYRVGSVSKLFTDLAVLQLVEEGKLSLDEDVRTYLPSFEPQGLGDDVITLRQLMSHRSGLVRESPVGNYFDPTEPSLETTVASLNHTEIVYPPGTRTKYSNAAIAVVGSILESKLNESHPTAVRQQLLDPLGMIHSRFEGSDADDTALAVGFMWTYDGRRFEAPDFQLGTGPAGNMISSVSELAKFMQCILNEGKFDDQTLFSAQTYALMTEPAAGSGFGLGFQTGQFDGHRRIGHGGAIYGYSTQFEALPDKGMGVIAASSLDGSNPVISRLVDYALRLMLAIDAEEELPEYARTTDLPKERARQLVGRYRELDGKRRLQIEELNGKASIQLGTYQFQLRSDASSGEIIFDDVLGYGSQVKQLPQDQIEIDRRRYRRVNESPAEIPEQWEGLIGEYGWDHNTLYILERDGQLYALIEWFYYYPLEEIDADSYAFPDYGLYHGERLQSERNDQGEATGVVAASVHFPRRSVGTRNGETFRIEPQKPLEELRETALTAEPPKESGEFRDSELVELTSLDPTIHLDIRYASTNNFMSAVFYQQPRAFMQRPAAEAVVRVQKKLAPLGLGLLIHDAYRPWYVTKMFWDATPAELKDFVANPANGSRHNRGCAVDLTLCDLATGEPLQMVSGYDEFSQRSFPQYPGGTSEQRYYRMLLRQTMESEGFAVYEYEWWHFDYVDWQKYRIGNETFEALLPAASSQWVESKAWPAEEAHQAAAIDDQYFYAISSTSIAKYDRQSGEKIATSTGDALHLNSGFFWQGQLLCAHSNYPRVPEVSEVKILDPATMKLSTFHNFGNYGGSLTWIVRHRGHWWCHFAKYGAENGQSFLVKFDDQWNELKRYGYPKALTDALGQYSLSGGLWWGEVLHVTPHDDRVIHRLRLPAEGDTLEWINSEPSPFTGQGIARGTDLISLVGIDRAKRRVILAELQHPTLQPRLQRDRLLEIRDQEGGIKQANTVEDWQSRREETLLGMQSVMGRIPGDEKRCDLEVEIVEEVDCGSYLRRLIHYRSEPDCWVPAYLCIPKELLQSERPTRAPAVLCLHSTDDAVGHGSVVGLGARAHRNYASELAERGYVTLAPSYPLLANYQPDLHGLGWESGTLKAIWDNIRGLDLLETMPFVQPGGFAAIGHSLGGHNSVYTAMHDDRIKVVVSSCGLDSYLDYYAGNPDVWLPERGWTQTRYMPRLAGYRGRLEEIPYDFYELIAGLSPRAVMISAPLGDDNFQASSVDRIVDAARVVYRLYGAENQLKVVHPDCPHDFPDEVREEAYQWIDAVLRK